MSAIGLMVRGSFVGEFLRRLTGNKILKYKEESSTESIHERYSSSISEFPISKKESSSEKDIIVVDFDGENDPESAYNWPLSVKIVITIALLVYCSFPYIASAIFIPSKDLLMEEFNINETVATLPLTIFVIAYGIGPMIFSPLSEHPAIGRNPIYVITLFLFAIMQIPNALVTNYAGFLVLRFISGILISPVLANAGASFSDIYRLPYLPLGLGAWGIGAYGGVSLGPLLGSSLRIASNDWRWSFWFLAIAVGVFTLLFAVFIPETYPKTILYNKAQRLRKITGNSNIVVDENLTSSTFSKETLKEMFWRPIEIGVYEPVILMINIYIGLVYAVTYLCFESIPIYYYQVRQFALIPSTVTYMTIVIGATIGAIFYNIVIYFRFTKPLLNNEVLYPESIIPISIIGSVILPIGIFIQAWTSAVDLPWIVPLIGASAYGLAGILLFQSLLNYIGMSFFKFTASAFASNAFFRSIFAACFPLFGNALFNNLSTDRFPVAWGVSILGFITVLMIGIPVYFYLQGPKLRARSKYSSVE